MTKLSTLLIALALVASFALPVWAGEDLDTVKQQLADSWDKLHSIQAKLTVKTYWPDKDEKLLETKRTGTYEHLKHEQVNLFRMYQEGEAFEPQGPGRGADIVNRKMLTISDGKYQYSLTDTNGENVAMKWRFDPHESPDPRTLLKALTVASDLVLKGQEESDGKKVYVIEATPKGAKHRISRVVYRFRADGIMLKQENYDRLGDLRYSMELTDVQTDVKIDPERFEFKPPPGVEVEDVTQ